MTDAITLTPEQSRALDAVGQWLKTRDQPSFKLWGVAGVGKTFLAKYLASQQDGTVAFVAYTGRACEMLRRNGCPARTIHSALYLPMAERGEELTKLRDELSTCADPVKERRLIRRIEELSQPKFVLRGNSPLRDASLIIADEMSMIAENEANDLLSFGVPLLTLGDPGQLPAIEGRGFFSSGEPDFLLTEIHRQAKDSPVLQLAHAAREGRPLRPGYHGESRVIGRRQVDKDTALGVAQILSGSNKARIQLNNENRALRGFEGWPRAGEKLICLRNNPRSGLFNGSQIELIADAVEKSDALLTLTTADAEYVCYKLCFTAPEHLKAMPWQKRAGYDEFDFSYALTVHRAQGGQWASVLVWDDLWKWDPAMHRKVLYTAISRAEERVVVAL